MVRPIVLASATLFVKLSSLSSFRVDVMLGSKGAVKTETASYVRLASNTSELPSTDVTLSAASVSIDKPLKIAFKLNQPAMMVTPFVKGQLVDYIPKGMLFWVAQQLLAHLKFDYDKDVRIVTLSGPTGLERTVVKEVDHPGPLIEHPKVELYMVSYKPTEFAKEISQYDLIFLGSEHQHKKEAKSFIFTKPYAKIPVFAIIGEAFVDEMAKQSNISLFELERFSFDNLMECVFRLVRAGQEVRSVAAAIARGLPSVASERRVHFVSTPGASYSEVVRERVLECMTSSLPIINDVEHLVKVEAESKSIEGLKAEIEAYPDTMYVRFVLGKPGCQDFASKLGGVLLRGEKGEGLLSTFQSMAVNRESLKNKPKLKEIFKQMVDFVAWLGDAGRASMELEIAREHRTGIIFPVISFSSCVWLLGQLFVFCHVLWLESAVF